MIDTKQINDILGIKEAYQLHAFRHLFATRFMEQIGDVTELKDILGHSSLDTTSIYSKSTKKQKKKHLDELWKNG